MKFTMKKMLAALLCVLAGGLLIWAGTAVWGIPAKSHAVIFYIVRFGFIPIPLPVGVFTLPTFWGGVLCVAGGVLCVRGLSWRDWK